jgi:site-specific DNA-methyltransferase (adenine-specific)
MLSDGETWRVIEGKWQESPPDEVDVIIADAPYDERTHKNSAYSGGAKFGVDSFDSIRPADFVPSLINTSNRWVIVFCTTEHIGEYSKAAGDRWVRAGWWRKRNGAPQFTGDRPAVPGDAIAIMHREGRKRWNGGGKHAYYDHNVCRKDRHHETQKPLPLMIELVEDFTDPGELVWDPYCGSGTTGVACLLTGRRFLGHEMQPRYAEIARDRLTATEQGLTLDDYYAGQTSLFGGAE